MAKHVTDTIGEQEREAVESRLGEELLRRRDEKFVRGEDAPLPQVREVSMPELLLASSFHLALAENPETGARWSVWGRGAKSGFDAAKDALSLDAEGSFRLRGTCRSGCAGEVDNTLTGVHPYLRYEGSNGLSAWGVLGHGRGEMTLTRQGGSGVDANTEMNMAAFGGRGVVLSPSNRWGFELAIRSDALFVSASSEAVSGVVDADADVSRFRLLLEVSREYRSRFGSEGALTPTLELGLRYDAGDAEKGSGLEVSGALRYRQPASGLAVEVAVRGLLTHEEKSYEEWGMSGSIRIDPGEMDMGLSMRLDSAWGASASGGAKQLWARRNVAGLARGADLPGARLAAEVAYGFDAPRGLLTPYTGVVLTENGETWRAGARWKIGPAFDVSLEASLKEPAGEEKPESGVLLRGSRRW